MTESEAKNLITRTMPKGNSAIDIMLRGALNVAIQALEEVQEYRATGLTPTMVMDLIKSEKKAHKTALENAHIVDDYREIGTVEEFKALKEKAEPKKVVIREIPKTSWTRATKQYICPSCNMVISFSGKRYCSGCSQRLDWK